MPFAMACPRAWISAGARARSGGGPWAACCCGCGWGCWWAMMSLVPELVPQVSFLSFILFRENHPLLRQVFVTTPDVQGSWAWTAFLRSRAALPGGGVPPIPGVKFPFFLFFFFPRGLLLWGRWSEWGKRVNLSSRRFDRFPLLICFY